MVRKEHVNEALTAYLRSLSILNDNQYITSFYKVPEGLDVQVEED